MADFRNTKEGRNVAQKYADILHLSRPEPPVKYPRMALSNRAKIFSPFAALRGFDDEISSEGASKLLVKKVELSDEEKDALSDKLLQVKKGMKVVVRYFVRSTESTGKYISLTGTVVMIDPVYRELKVMQNSDRKAVSIEKELPVIISFDDIAYCPVFYDYTFIGEQCKHRIMSCYEYYLFTSYEDLHSFLYIDTCVFNLIDQNDRCTGYISAISDH